MRPLRGEGMRYKETSQAKPNDRTRKHEGNKKSTSFSDRLVRLHFVASTSNNVIYILPEDNHTAF